MSCIAMLLLSSREAGVVERVQGANTSNGGVRVDVGMKEYIACDAVCLVITGMISIPSLSSLSLWVYREMGFWIIGNKYATVSPNT